MPSNGVVLFFEMKGSVIYIRLWEEMSGGGGVRELYRNVPNRL
jgi:hypothetical protein